MYTIGQFAKKTGVTVRTLHYYDEKGHRFYIEDHIQTLQTILVCKYLNYRLDDIKAVLTNEMPFLQALYVQKKQLEEKRQQLDQMIACMDLAIEIHEKSARIDPTSLLIIIHSLFTIEDQKQYLRNFLSEQLVDKIYIFFDVNFVDLNRRYIIASFALKEAYKQSVEDSELKKRILDLLAIMPRELSELMLEEMQEKEIVEMDKWLFTSLFTHDEELWLEQQLNRLNIREELGYEITNAAVMDTSK